MLRAFFVVFGVAIFLFLVGPFCVLYALIRRSPDILYAAGRAGSRLGLYLGGVKLVVRGRENIESGRPFLFLANHQSYSDPPALFVSIPRNVRLSESPSYGVPAMLYDASSRGSQAYAALAQELIQNTVRR